MNVSRIHLVVAVVAFIPIFWVAETYLNTINAAEPEAMATAVTILALAFAYGGRRLAERWIKEGNTITNREYTVLGAVIGIAGLWLIIYPDFNPLHGRAGLTLLMYLIPFTLLTTATGAFIKFIRINQQLLKDATITASHSKSELQLLQSQISPHFLFNTLNNLYGISISRHEKIPALLLKLSELLRYSVYDAKELFVPLKDEMTYILNYIDFEKLRLGDRLKISTAVEQSPANLQIAPMILIVFVENAFKHSKNSADENIYIEMELRTRADTILFSVKNSFSAGKKAGIKEKYSGFGLENVKRRLDMLYSGRYLLKNEVQNNLFCVTLELKIR